MENTISKEKVAVSLDEIRDGLITDAKKNLDEWDLQTYSNGVLDMYNNFVRVLKGEPKEDTNVTYEG